MQNNKSVFCLDKTPLNVLLLTVWLGAVVLLLFDSGWLRWSVSVTLVIYIISALAAARRETLWVLSIIAGLGILLLLTGAAMSGLMRGVERTLVFAALLPTLQLVRATARRMQAIKISQQRFAALPQQQTDIGILFGSQAFGAVLNTGAFAFMSALISDDTPAAHRRTAALASLRGMNIAVLWSPFFVGFAVASTYLPAVQLWQIMPLGLFLVACGLAIALALFARPLSFTAISAALSCLQPIAPHIIIAAGLVILCSLLTSLSTLAAILLIMPVLCVSQWLLQPNSALPVLLETYAGLGRMGDDLIIIAAAMMLGTVAENAPLIAAQLAPWLADTVPQTLVISAVVLVMAGCGMMGIHPMISGTVMMISLSGKAQQICELALMEAMLLGWALASMISISSLSVITAGAMYRVPPLRLAYSKNLFFVLCYALFVILVLTVVDALLKQIH